VAALLVLAGGLNVESWAPCLIGLHTIGMHVKHVDQLPACCDSSSGLRQPQRILYAMGLEVCCAWRCPLDQVPICGTGIANASGQTANWQFAGKSMSYGRSVLAWCRASFTGTQSSDSFNGESRQSLRCAALELHFLHILRVPLFMLGRALSCCLHGLCRAMFCQTCLQRHAGVGLRIGSSLAVFCRHCAHVSPFLVLAPALVLNRLLSRMS
jgi:hypothetical protein